MTILRRGWNGLDHFWSWIGVRHARSRNAATILLLILGLLNALTSQLKIVGLPFIVLCTASIGALVAVASRRAKMVSGEDGRRSDGFRVMAADAFLWLARQWESMGIADRWTRRLLSVWVLIVLASIVIDVYVYAIVDVSGQWRTVETGAFMAGGCCSLGLRWILARGDNRRLLSGCGIAAFGIGYAILALNRNRTDNGAYLGAAGIVAGIILSVLDARLRSHSERP